MENKLLDKMTFRKVVMRFVDTMRRLQLEDEDIIYTSQDVEMAYIDYIARHVEAMDVE